MITIRLEPCCKNCHFSSLYLDEEKLYKDGDIYDVDITVFCLTERICKFRKDSSEPIKPMKWGDDEYQGPKRLIVNGHIPEQHVKTRPIVYLTSR